MIHLSFEGEPLLNFPMIKTLVKPVAGKGTAQEISASLGITSPTEPTASAVGTVMVLEIASYYGRATSDIWDWVKAKWEATGG
jgi:hypothetical protein